MSIVDYSSLQTAVINWMHRTGDTGFAAVVPDAIAMLEGELNGRLKSRSMEIRTTLSTVASNAYVTLPADVVEVRRVLLSSTSPMRPLVYSTPDELSKDYPYGDATGEPRAFTVISGAMQLAPIPDAVYSLELAYVQKLPPLASNTTNWLLTAHPEVYLFGTMLFLLPYINNPERIAEIKSFYQEAVEALNITDWYTGTTMTVRAG